MKKFVKKKSDPGSPLLPRWFLEYGVSAVSAHEWFSKVGNLSFHLTMFI